MSKKSSWIVVIIALAMLFFMAVFLVGMYRLFRPAKTKVLENSVLELDFSEEIPELPPTSALEQLVKRNVVSLYELGRLLKLASGDPQIAAVHLSIYPSGISWAQVEEIRGDLKEFHQSKKRIVASLAGDMAGEKEMYLASLADEIYLNPDAGLLINGFNVDVLFFKRAMEKLQIVPQMLMLKEYKNPESFTREKLTPEFRSMYEGLLSDVQNRFIQTVAEDRKISPARLRELMNVGMAPASVAMKEGLVTALGYDDEIQSEFLNGKSPASKEYRGITASDYLKAMQDRLEKKGRHRVALVGGIGEIISGESDDFWGNLIGGETMAARLREIRNEKDIEGVLFRIDSPGGSAVGSDKVWREVRLLEKSGKKVVVSMSGVAGSGGYYIAMGASKIVAQPSTITGSIGVLFAKFDIHGLFEHWLGITTDQIKLAENADILSPYHSLSAEQMTQVQSWMGDIYNNFVKKAAEGRGMSFEELEPKAHGRIYTGAQARAIHLVDELGGFNTALQLLKKELKIPASEDVDLVLYPKTKSLWQSLLEGDLFKANLRASPISLESRARKMFQELESPAPWLLIPEINFH